MKKIKFKWFKLQSMNFFRFFVWNNLRRKIRMLLFIHQWRSGMDGKTFSVGRNSKYMQNCGLFNELNPKYKFWGIFGTIAGIAITYVPTCICVVVSNVSGWSQIIFFSKLVTFLTQKMLLKQSLLLYVIQLGLLSKNPSC